MGHIALDLLAVGAAVSVFVDVLRSCLAGLRNAITHQQRKYRSSSRQSIESSSVLKSENDGACIHGMRTWGVWPMNALYLLICDAIQPFAITLRCNQQVSKTHTHTLSVVWNYVKYFRDVVRTWFIGTWVQLRCWAAMLAWNNGIAACSVNEHAQCSVNCAGMLNIEHIQRAKETTLYNK